MQLVRVGFLGAGLIAHAHANGLTGSSTPVTISSVYDPDHQRSQQFADRFAAKMAPDVGAVIDDSDAVYVCTWTSEHRALVEIVVAAGRAVFCEKPLAPSLAEATALADSVQRSGVVNQVGLVLRHSPAFAMLRQLVHAPSAGRVVSMIFRDDQYIPTQGMYGSTWRADVSKAGAGALLEHSIHDIDLIEHTVGRIVGVNARSITYHQIAGIEDVMAVGFELADGAIGSLVTIWHDNLARPSQRRVEVFCEHRYVSLENDWLGPVRWQDSSGDEGTLEGAALFEAGAPLLPPAGHPDHGFAAAVMARTPAYPDVAVALRAHVVADAIYRSAAAKGHAVDCG
ncbi:MAG TPA: Gfo/Idh/MocA family oxidoreductase [Acidimicrobiales bacterium]|nr:Gfo/Idh/MocA family oxidoreductase [Acidimicrobiales bacterium]